MKMNGLLRRALSLLLVLAMVLPMMPLSAFAYLGEVTDQGMELPDGGTGVSNDDTVSWPVKIYDYLNDGMLFEYAQANDETTEKNLYYGGGMPMPFQDEDMIGNDYTITSTYQEKAWNKWVSKDAYDREGGAEVDATVVQAVDDESPMYAHFKYIKDTPDTDANGNPVNDPAKDVGTKYRAWISDFYTDNGTYYDKDQLRYIVIVYRTNEVMDNASINFRFRPSAGKDYDYDGPDRTLPASTEWTYFVYDMYKDSTTWAAIEDNIQYVRFTFPLNGIINGVAEEMDISHIAYFGSKEEAENFGKKAVVFDNDPGYCLSKSYSGGAEEPLMFFGQNFTGEDAYSSNATSLIVSNDVASVTEKISGGLHYAYMKGTDSYRDYCRITDFYNDQGGSVDKNFVRYAVIVYKSTQLSYTTARFDLNGGSYGSYHDFPESSSWTYRVFDLAEGNSDWDGLTYVSNVCMNWPGLNSNNGDYLDVSHIAYFASEEAATEFGEKALAFNANPGTYYGNREWNMGNNAAFAMLYASAGGAWETTSAVGGETDQPNSYFTYSIGKLHDNSQWSSIQSTMNEKHDEGVNGADTKIHLIYPYSGSDYADMSTYDFDGYNLFGTIIQNGTSLFTAGLVEPTLETVTYADGTSDRRMVYREETVDYIAELLSYTLIIPRFDSNGNPNYNYVRGTASTQFGTDANGEAIDLAQALRNCLGITFTAGANKGTATAKMGTYAETLAKKDSLLGAFSTCKGNITTFYDAAYYLLNNLFIKNSYNEKQDDYTYLQLNKVEGTTGTYIFDGGFTNKNATSAVDYGTDQILNMVDAVSKHSYVFEIQDSGKENSTTRYPFLPVTDANNNSQYDSKTTYSPYFADDGVDSVSVEGNTYMGRNFNYVMATNGEFHYYAEDELFFQFEGDDDVYLFLNNQLVLDIGAAHQISVVEFKVDDYVDWAWNIKNGVTTYDGVAYENLSAEKKARVDALALSDGDICSFDFYYMERHGFGANCRIMTNIRVTDPAMDVTKSAYQDGVQVSEGGIINEDLPVEYGFAMTNDGDSALYRLVFKDEDIGITLSWNNGLEIVDSSKVCDVNGGTLEASDLTALITHPDYDDIAITFADNDALKAFLYDGTAAGMQAGQGLFVGSTVLIRGFAYKLTTDDKDAGKFFNTVKAEANSKPDGTGKPLISEDDMRVFIAAEPMYYQWAGEDHVVNVTLEKLVADIKAAANIEGNALNGQGLDVITKDNISAIAESNATGSLRDYPHVTVNSDKSLDIHYDVPGSYVFYVKITCSQLSGGSAVIPVLVNVADVVDSVFVLDYGLNAVLTQNGELHKGDTLSVPARPSGYTLMGIADGTADTAPSYGSNTITFNKEASNQIGDTADKSSGDEGSYDGMFTLDGTELSYKPYDFMDQRDKIWLALSVHEQNFAGVLGATDINKEAQMYKSVTVLPANVVYYEDDFPAIKYSTVTEDGIETVKNVITKLGDGSESLNQDIDQDQEYGQDSNYQTNSHDMSGNSVHKITIKDANTFASFVFTGTGFELIGSTLAENPASLAVTVTDEDGNLEKRIPVITEFDNGNNGGDEEIYQVPVIRVEGLDYDTYTVNINGVPTYERQKDANGNYVTDENGYIVSTLVESVFYLDGLRIFEPLAKTETAEDGTTTVNPGAADEYRPEESDVTFLEIREEILNGKVAHAKVEGETVTVSSALSTWTENLNNDSYDESGELKDVTYTTNAVTTIEDYLIKGPNNEVYMNGDLDEAALIFYVKETDEDVEHDLQIAVHAIDAAKFYIGSDITGDEGFNAVVKYGAYDAATQTFSWEALATVTSATEQYYTIPYEKCYSADGWYQIAIYVDSGMASFTSLKLNGLELKPVADASGTPTDSTTLFYKEGMLCSVGADGVAGTDDDVYVSGYTPELVAVSYQMRRMTLAVAEEPEETTPTEPEVEETTEPTAPETEPEVEETTEPTTPETEPEVEETEPETEPSKPGSNKPGNNRPGNSSAADKLQNLWKSLWESVDYLLKLVGRR